MRARLGILALLTVFAGAFVGIRYAARDYPPGALALLRFGIASAVLAGYQLVRSGRLAVPRARDVPGLTATGLFGVTLYHLALNAGERSVSAAEASLLVNTTPIFAALLAMVALRERPRGRALAGIAIGFVGAAIVSLGESPGGLVLDRGAVLVVAAGLSAALYYVLEKPYLQRYRPLDVTAWGFWAGTVLLLPFAGELAAAVRAAPPSATLAVAWLGVFPAAIGYVAWSHVLARMEVTRAAALLYLIPPLAALLGWVLLGEPVGGETVLGGAVTIVGVALVNGRRVRAPAAAARRRDAPPFEGDLDLPRRPRLRSLGPAAAAPRPAMRRAGAPRFQGTGRAEAARGVQAATPTRSGGDEWSRGAERGRTVPPDPAPGRAGAGGSMRRTSGGSRT